MERTTVTPVLRSACLAAALACFGGCVTETDFAPELEGANGDGGVGGATAAVRDATPAPANFLLPLVQVFTWRGMCSGTLIATDRVLTAAHCVCTEDLVGDNVCVPHVSVLFRPNPATGAPTPAITGMATHHPSYNPSWTDQEIEHDMAVIALDSPAPTYDEADVGL